MRRLGILYRLISNYFFNPNFRGGNYNRSVLSHVVFLLNSVDPVQSVVRAMGQGVQQSIREQFVGQSRFTGILVQGFPVRRLAIPRPGAEEPLLPKRRFVGNAATAGGAIRQTASRYRSCSIRAMPISGSSSTRSNAKAYATIFAAVVALPRKCRCKARANCSFLISRI